MSIQSMFFGRKKTKPSSRAYVVNSADDTVSIIDLASNTTVATVIVPDAPSKVSINPTLKKVYVLHGTGLSYIDTRDNNVITTALTLDSGSLLAHNTNHTKLYAVSGGNVIVIDPTTDTVSATITGITNPSSITFDHADAYAYVSSLIADTIYKVNLSTNTVITSYDTGENRGPIAINNDGTRIYYYGTLNSAYVLSYINPAMDAVAAAVVPPSGKTFHTQTQFAITPDNKVCAALTTSGLYYGTTEITTAGQVSSIKFTPDGVKAYIGVTMATGVERVYVLDVATKTFITYIDVGNGSAGLDINDVIVPPYVPPTPTPTSSTTPTPTPTPSPSSAATASTWQGIGPGTTYGGGGTTFSNANGITIANGNVLIAIIACDNVSTVATEESTRVLGLSDAANSTWNCLGKVTNGRYGVSDGVEVSVWAAVINDAETMNANGTVQVLLDAAYDEATMDCVVTSKLFSTNAYGGLVVEAHAVYTANNDFPDPISITGLNTNNYLFLRALATEDAPTDRFTTSGWSDIGSMSSGLTATAEYMAANGTNATSGAFFTPSTDYASLMLAIKAMPSAAPVPSPSPTPSPTPTPTISVTPSVSVTPAPSATPTPTPVPSPTPSPEPNLRVDEAGTYRVDEAGTYRNYE